MSEQKVKITIKKEFSNELIRRQTTNEQNEMVLNEYNQAWLGVVVGYGGREINAVLTEDMRFAVIVPTCEIPIMIEYDFVEMDNVKPQGSCYFSHKMYRMGDADNQLGIYIEMKFDPKKGVRYVLLNTSMERIEGSIMTELSDDELDKFKFGSRKEYYKD